jgi:dihydroxy-acid dehydratase
MMSQTPQESQSASQRIPPESLRSHRWFGPDDLRSFGHRSRAKQMGYGPEDYERKPVIAIVNTWSDLNTCHTHFPQRVEQIKRGVLQAGGFPVEIPALSLGEMFMKPTTMMYRNLLAMETEEVLRCHPIDGAVLMGGCDKTTPALLMGAISMNLPAIFMPAGPMIKAHWKGESLASGTDVWRNWDKRRAGQLCEDAWLEFEDRIAPSAGVCMTMGTASTMASLVEALGMTLPGASSIPAPHSMHERMAAQCGRRIVDMVWQDLKPSDIVTEQAFENAITADMAIGGSTNGIIHLTAMAGRAGIKLDLDRFDQISQSTPLIANIQPCGKYVMEDFYIAGGMPAALARIKNKLHLGCNTVNGKTLGDNIANAEVYDDDVIRPLDNPVATTGGTYVLGGNLAPDGCVIKPFAAEAKLLKHKGPAVVFKDYDDMAARIDDPDLPVTADSVLVLQSAGPLGAPGMPEWGMLPIPKKLLAQGVRDMVRISDARMSGTSFGACVLHIAPESFIGGPLALVQDGDMIELDVEQRRLHLDIDDQELTRRRNAWQAPPPRYQRGYGLLFSNEVTQANEGCDFRFLHHGAPTPDPPIH